MQSVNNKNNVLIYDKTQKNIRFINHYCGYNIQAVCCRSITELEGIDIKTIATVYFFLETRSDCRIILKLRKLVDCIYIIADDYYKDEFAKFNNILFVSIKSYSFNMIYEIYQKTIELDNIK